MVPWRPFFVLACGISLASLTSVVAEEAVSQAEAAQALRRAVNFFRQQVSIEGAYLWRYSADLAKREGEGQASPTTAWVQPPGTPTVGMGLLTIYRNTGDADYLEAARETALALVRGQLASGGWDYRIEFAPAERKNYAYRSGGAWDASARNTTTLDDNTTQAALTFLMQLDRQLRYTNEEIHAAVLYALECLLQAQYPNGAWPQRYRDFPTAEEFPVHQANYPDSWPRKYPGADYRNYYTFNDNSIADTIRVMLDAAEIYEQPRFREAALRAGDFIILAQMPDPQPAWAQQYNQNCQPAWARRFEPPAVTGGESQGILSTLLELYRRSGEKRFLSPVPRALKYLEGSLLQDGRLARFYELKTNRPLFFTRSYELVYHDRDLPTHYGFKVGSGLARIRARYEQLLEDGPDRQASPYVERTSVRVTEELAVAASQVVATLDERGAWVDNAPLRYQGEDDGTTEVIQTETFLRNTALLSRYVGARSE